MSLTKVQINLGTTGNLSGSRSLASASFASRVSLVEDGTTSKTLVSGSAQLAADISGSFGNQRVGTTDSPVFNAVTVGTATVTGTLTAQEVHTEFESASILFTSGSTQFGNSSDDVHDFLGNTISGSATSTGSFGSIVTKGTGVSSFTSNVTMANNLDVDGTTNLDVVDIDGAVNISSDSVPQLTIGGGTPTIYLGDSGAEDTKLVFRGNATDVYLALDDSVDRFLIGQGTTVGGDARIYINPADGEVTASGNFAITDRLTVGAWDNSNSHGHANINISADANEGADSSLNFAAGTTIKGYIAYDHNATAGSQALRFVVGDAAVTAMNINGDGRVIIRNGLLEVGEHGVAGGQIVSDGSLTFNAGYNDSSTGNGDFIFQRYGESTTAATVAQIFSTGNAYFGGVASAVNSSHFQYASTFGDTSAARVGFFNAASGNSSTDKTMHLNIGCMGHGTSAYHPTNMVIASINFLGQANDATYAGGGIDMLVSTGGNIGRTSVGTDMLFRTMDTSGNGGEERMRITSNGHLEPGGNNAYNLGSASLRWSVVFTSNSVNVSDETLKTDIQDCDLGIDSINTLKPKSFKMKDLEEKHSDYDKKHYGLIAQDLKDGKFKDSVYGDKDGEYGLAYNDLIAPMIKAVQELSAKVEALES